MDSQGLNDPKLNTTSESADEIETLLGKFKCKVCSISFESLVQHLNKTDKCKSKYSGEELDHVKEQSKRRTSLKNKLWKRDHKDWRSGYNSTYYEKNHSTIAEKSKIKYQQKKEEYQQRKEEEKILMREESGKNHKAWFEGSKISRHERLKSNNKVCMRVFETSTLIYINKFRTAGVDEETENTFKMYESEAKEIFQTFEAKFETAEKESNEILYETPDHHKKLNAIYKELEFE